METEYDSKGNIVSIYEKQYGQKEGRCLTFYENGNIHTISDYKNGIISGDYFEYDENNQLYRKLFFVKGKLVQVFLYNNKDGKLTNWAEYYYNNDGERIINQWKEYDKDENIIFDKSFFYTLNVSDTIINYGDSIKIDFKLNVNKKYADYLYVDIHNEEEKTQMIKFHSLDSSFFYSSLHKGNNDLLGYVLVFKELDNNPDSIKRSIHIFKKSIFVE